MKVKINNYTFSASAKTVTLTDYTSIPLDDIILITNVTTGTIIYNFADPTLTATVANNVITLAYNTTSMSNSDKLAIYIDNESSPASDEMLQAIYEMARNLGVLAATRGTLADLRVTPTGTVTVGGTVTATGTLTGVTTVSTVSTVTNQAQIGGYNAIQQIPALQNNAAIASNINNITITVS
jgi:hypothetical protein